MLVHLHDDEKLPPPLEWAGVHVRPHEFSAKAGHSFLARASGICGQPEPELPWWT